MKTANSDGNLHIHENQREQDILRTALHFKLHMKFHTSLAPMVHQLPLSN